MYRTAYNCTRCAETALVVGTFHIRNVTFHSYGFSNGITGLLSGSRASLISTRYHSETCTLDFPWSTPLAIAIDVPRKSLGE